MPDVAKNHFECKSNHLKQLNLRSEEELKFTEHILAHHPLGTIKSIRYYRAHKSRWADSPGWWPTPRAPGGAPTVKT